ncbi:MAG: AMP-binding protein, partial [Acidimicrobiia bacterium]
MKRTIPLLFDAAVDAAPSKTWLLCEDRSFTYEEAHAAIATGAGALAGRGVRQGDLVLVTLRNTPEYLFTWLALMRLGAILVAANPAST